MIALYILLVILLLCVLLCLVKIRVEANYNDSLTLKIKVLFLTFTLVPWEKKKKPAKPKKKIPQKKKDNKQKKEKNPSYIKKLSDKKGVNGLLSMLSDIAKLCGTTLKGLINNIVIDKLNVSITVVGDDAADTALKYGKLCGVFYSAVAVICRSVKKYEQYNLNVTPDFDDEASMQAKADAEFYIRTFYVLKYALVALYKLLLIRYKR